MIVVKEDAVHFSESKELRFGFLTAKINDVIYSNFRTGGSVIIAVEHLGNVSSKELEELIDQLKKADWNVRKTVDQISDNMFLELT